jgi:transmembrane sensor
MTCPKVWSAESTVSALNAMLHSSELPCDVLQQAAEWYARLRTEHAGQQERELWQAWLDADASHRAAWAQVEQISSHFAPLQEVPNPRRVSDTLLKAEARLRQRRRLLGSFAGMAMAGGLGWATWRYTPLPGLVATLRADYRSDTGEIREILLTDGTRVWLNTASAFDQHYAADKRRLVLVRGEMLVETGHAASAPFVVETHHGQLRPLGTRFSVRLDGNATHLAVFDGRVEVRINEGDATAIVPAGQQLQFNARALQPMQPADANREAWSRGLLYAQDIPLAEVMAELRRYHHGYLGVAPEVAGLRVFGTLPLQDRERSLAMLESVLPVRVRHTLPWWVTLEAVGSSG